MTLLQAYDAQLRGDCEVVGALETTRLGPLWLAVFEGGSGFVGYRDLRGIDGDALDDLIEEAIAHFRDSTDVAEFEWKTRGHDLPPDLTERLVAHGLTPEDAETVMVGEAAQLAVEVELPPGVSIRRAGTGRDLGDDVHRALAMQDLVFGKPWTRGMDSLVEDLRDHSDLRTMWLAEADGEVVCAGRLEIVEGTEFAGLWGGATHPDWRGRGIYRALTAARARHAIAAGITYLQSDCSPMSRPILERAGLEAITTTTPYMWRRG